MNTIENLIQIVENKHLEYAELELKLDSLGILDGVIKQELTNAMNLLEWVLWVAQQTKPPKITATVALKSCRTCKYEKREVTCDKCMNCDGATVDNWEAQSLTDLIEETWASCNSLVRFKELMERAYQLGYETADDQWRLGL